LIKIQI